MKDTVSYGTHISLNEKIGGTNFPEVNISRIVTQSEKRIFIQKVLRCVNEDEKDLLFFNLEESFVSNFLEMFTDYDKPFESVDDIDLNVALRKNVLSNPFACSLFNNIRDQITHRHTSNDAIETVSYLSNRCLSAVNSLCDVLDNIGGLTKDGKFLKVISKSKLNSILDCVNNFIVNLSKTFLNIKNSPKQ